MRKTQLLSANMTINQVYSNCTAIDYYCTLMKHLLYFIPLTTILTTNIPQVASTNDSRASSALSNTVYIHSKT